MEVCVETVDDAVAAATGGADRLELNSALALDGLTPSHGLLLETRRAVRAPVVVMARPRAGDFCYSASEFEALQRDVEHALELGADGIAFGILDQDDRIDLPRCGVVLRLTSGKAVDVVFHRAFDATPDPLAALDQLIDLGVRRVMTSGGHRSAPEGADVIRRLVDRAAGRIEVLPAGGIRPDNAARVIERTGCRQLHTSLRDASGRMSATALAEMVRVTR